MRLLILLLSMGSVVFYGYALAGMGGFLIGRGRLDYVLFGLFLGTASAIASLLLWRRWLLQMETEMAREMGNGK